MTNEELIRESMFLTGKIQSATYSNMMRKEAIELAKILKQIKVCTCKPKC